MPLVAGWVVLFPAIAVVWIWGITKTFGGRLPPTPADMPPSPPGAFPLTHLWFLYYLLVLYAVVVRGPRRRGCVRSRRPHSTRLSTSTVRRAVSVGAAAVLLPLPLIASLYFRDDWVVWFGIPTPDHSLIPERRRSSATERPSPSAGSSIVRPAFWRRGAGSGRCIWRGAVAATGLCLWMVGVAPVFVPASAGSVQARVCALLRRRDLVLELCRHRRWPCVTCRTRRAGIRYVADASYWIYLVHLPIVAAFQVVVGRLPWHWSIKFPLILVASLALLLASYRYLVRSTFIGSAPERAPVSARAVGGAATRCLSIVSLSAGGQYVT